MLLPVVGVKGGGEEGEVVDYVIRLANNDLFLELMEVVGTTSL